MRAFVWQWMALAAFVVLFSGSAPAQEADGGEEPKPAIDRNGEAGGEKAPGAPDEETEIASIWGEKVEARLLSGVVVTGVVKGSRAEILWGAGYAPAENRSTKGAGIRVYYAFGLNGFLFIPYEKIESIQFKGALNSDEGTVIAQELREAHQRSEEVRTRVIREIAAKKAAARAEAEDGEKPSADESGEAEARQPRPADREAAQAKKEAALSERAERIKNLLTRFPPPEWKPARLDEIKYRSIILDIYPSEAERAFMESYDLWLEGYEMWKQANPESAAGSGDEVSGTESGR